MNILQTSKVTYPQLPKNFLRPTFFSTANGLQNCHQAYPKPPPFFMIPNPIFSSNHPCKIINTLPNKFFEPLQVIHPQLSLTLTPHYSCCLLNSSHLCPNPSPICIVDIRMVLGFLHLWVQEACIWWVFGARTRSTLSIFSPLMQFLRVAQVRLNK